MPPALPIRAHRGSLRLPRLACLVLASLLVAQAPAMGQRKAPGSARQGAGAGLSSTPLPERAPLGAAPRFARLPAERTGVDFRHRFTDDRQHVNVLANAMSGGGVAVGDYDGDGRDDLYFTRSAGGGRLYRNLGGLRFEDVTAAAGVTDGEAWGTGASFLDVDGDDDLDLYVCGYSCPNRLFVNQGDGTFVEGAAAAGLAFSGASIIGAFADYDADGDLDVYLLTNRINPFEEPDGQVPTRDGVPYLPEGMAEQFDVLMRPDGGATLVAAGQFDHLYQNQGDGTFREVSEAAGISGNHFGLSANWWDYDADGQLDLYVANDFFGPDKLYRNQGDGTFVDMAAKALPHTPWFSMGSDAGDVDNDGWLDFFASDMAGTTYAKRQTAMGEVDDVRWFLDTPTPRQAMRNALYRNTGAGVFQELAWMAGLEASDWTWSPVFGDLDEDGWLDLYISNGMTRPFFDSDLRRRAFSQGNPNDAVKTFWIDQPVMAERNLAFRNTGELRFDSVGADWGLDHQGVSFGAALVDLDGDGDLDVVTNDYDAEAGVYENRSSEGRRIAVTLRGRASNGQGFGAVLRVRSSSGERMRTVGSTHGFMTSVGGRQHVGLGRDRLVQELVVEWPSGHIQRFTDLPADQAYVITEPPGAGPGPAARVRRLPQPLFAGSLGVDVLEQPYDEFARQPLLPWRLSRLGPGLAAGDLDGNGTLEFVVGGPGGTPTQVFRNVDNQRFEAWPQPALALDDYYEDMGLALLDVDADGDDDLYVVSGGVECRPGSRVLTDRLYLNDGAGELARAPDGSLPDVRDSGSVVAAADVDRDGDLDLFVGGRSIPGEYPRTPASRLLRNDGGRFTDVTETQAPGLLAAGLVTSGSFGDVDGDGWIDLVIAREWGTVGLWHNAQGRLVDATADAGLANRHGLWNGVLARDLEGDGDIDLVVTNLGLNTRYEASVERPLQLYFGDCDGSGSERLVEATWDGDRLVPVRCRSCTVHAMPFLGELFPTFASYAAAELHDLYPPELLAQTLALSVDTLESGVFTNDGAGHFHFDPLPRLAQIAPAYGALAEDLDGDGRVDLVLAQNSHAPQAETGRFDGGVGQVLMGLGGRGGFRVVPPFESGVVVPDDGKSLVATDFDGDGFADLIMGVNDGPLHAFYNLHPGPAPAHLLLVDLDGPPGNPSAVGARVTVTRPDGVTQMAEVTAGGGYLSQGPPTLRFGMGPSTGEVSVVVRWPDGTSTSQRVPALAGRVRLGPR